MGKIAQFVVGPAGSGKSTYCHQMAEHFRTTGRSLHIVNLDPAAEYLPYSPTFDIRQLISLEDCMEELDYGPNGGLVFCMEYLLNNLDWLEEQLGDFDDDYLLIDCPGQVELYTNVPMMRNLTQTFQNWRYTLVGVYCLEAITVIDPARFISGFLACLSTMYQFSLPHVNVLTKCDLVGNKELLNDISPGNVNLFRRLDTQVAGKFKTLNLRIAELLEENDVVAFTPLNYNEDESLSDLLLQVDLVTQYFDDMDVKDKDYDIE
ncbi:hypothetical protein GEMRC1_011590 [Eukaryota sp. GEM-RC1]